MEIFDALSEKQQRQMETKTKRALRQLANKKDIAAIIPIHVANMQILVDNGKGGTKSQILPVIVPKMNIYIDNTKHRDGMIDRNAIEYRIAENNAIFPLAHVYRENGHLCLGNIFVPHLIPEYSPQLALETLFLHNDRNTNHGGAWLSIDKKQLNDIVNYLAIHGIIMTPPTLSAFNIRNIVKSDAIWRLSHDVLTFCESPEIAMMHMEIIYQIIFADN